MLQIIMNPCQRKLKIVTVKNSFCYIYKMRLLFVLCICICSNIFAQNDLLAKDYFEKGDFEKALHEYKKLYAGSPSNINYINQLVITHQELEQYDAVESLLLKIMERINYPAFLVDLGYNYQRKNELEKANIQYNAAIASLDANVNNVFAVARNFQKHALLNQTIAVYEKAIAINPNLNFELELAKIYGEQGKIEKMFTSYIDFAQRNASTLSNIKRLINDFISESSLNENNIIFRKILLKKNQQEPNLLWNDLLSWMFIQQKDFNKAFVQEKAIYNRQLQSLHRIEELALIASNENDFDTAKAIFEYLIETAQDSDTTLKAYYNLLQLEIKTALPNNYDAIDTKYNTIFDAFGLFSQTYKLQIAYAHFLAFYNNDTAKATSFLEKTLKLPLTELALAEVKLELGDILVLQEKFNQALIYYTQIQRNLKNSTISQTARFKVAKASYYKGDFKWAESQLKILKASTSQLIANDALDLKLLITDNKYEDSLQTALKLYAKADLLTFQNKNTEAISLLDTILKNHKTEPIIPQALLKQAQLFENNNAYEKAKTNYQSIIENDQDGILVDNALYALANIYEKHLSMPEKAKALYEQIIFNHADSIYFVEARKKYRTLRGDAIN